MDKLRELDGQLHVKLFGLRLPDHDYADPYCDCVPYYSTDPTVAMGVVIDALKALGYNYVEIHISPWIVICEIKHDATRLAASGSAQSVSEALCRAALQLCERREPV